MSPRVKARALLRNCSAPCRKGGEGLGAEPHEVRGEPRVKCKPGGMARTNRGGGAALAN